MAIVKRIEAPKVGNHMYIDMPDGSYIMVSMEKKKVVVDIFGTDDECAISCEAEYNKLRK